VIDNKDFGFSYPGYRLPGPILSRNNRFQITFKANTHEFGRGFLISFQAGKGRLFNYLFTFTEKNCILSSFVSANYLNLK